MFEDKLWFKALGSIAFSGLNHIYFYKGFTTPLLIVEDLDCNWDKVDWTITGRLSSITSFFGTGNTGDFPEGNSLDIRQWVIYLFRLLVNWSFYKIVSVAFRISYESTDPLLLKKWWQFTFRTFLCQPVIWLRIVKETLAL